MYSWNMDDTHVAEVNNIWVYLRKSCGLDKAPDLTLGYAH